MRHIIAILLQNEAGALTRVTGLISSRGYNIESLSVAPTDDSTVSRVTLVTIGSEPVIAQINAQLLKLVDVVGVEDLTSGETVACGYTDFPDHFGFFLPLAGITTVKQVRESSFDIRATSRLNRLYVELLKDNPEWGTAERRRDMNHFMARLIFCSSFKSPIAKSFPTIAPGKSSTVIATLRCGGAALWAPLLRFRSPVKAPRIRTKIRSNFLSLIDSFLWLRNLAKARELAGF